MHGLGPFVDKPVFFSMARFTRPEFVGECALAETAMRENDISYAMLCASGGRGAGCSACRCLVEADRAYALGEAVGLYDLKSWYFATVEGKRHLALWGYCRVFEFGGDEAMQAEEVDWEDALELAADARGGADGGPSREGAESDAEWCSLEEVRNGLRRPCDSLPVDNTEEEEPCVALCEACGRWLFGWRNCGHQVKESCICRGGKLKEKIERLFPLVGLPDRMVFLCSTNALVKDAYKVNQLLSMTAHTMPSSRKTRGANHPRFNAAFKAAGRLCAGLRDYVWGLNLLGATGDDINHPSSLPVKRYIATLLN